MYALAARLTRSSISQLITTSDCKHLLVFFVRINLYHLTSNNNLCSNPANTISSLSTRSLFHPSQMILVKISFFSVYDCVTVNDSCDCSGHFTSLPYSTSESCAPYIKCFTPVTLFQNASRTVETSKLHNIYFLPQISWLTIPHSLLLSLPRPLTLAPLVVF